MYQATLSHHIARLEHRAAISTSITVPAAHRGVFSATRERCRAALAARHPRLTGHAGGAKSSNAMLSGSRNESPEP